MHERTFPASEVEALVIESVFNVFREIVMMTRAIRSRFCLRTALEGIDADFVGTEDAFEEDRMRRNIFHVYRFHSFYSSLLGGTSFRPVVPFPFVGFS